jgi:hypothetical protein
LSVSDSSGLCCLSGSLRPTTKPDKPNRPDEPDRAG